MWISQAAYLRGVEERLKVQQELEASKALVASQKSTLEWLMLRMTQLEAERAKLLWKYMGVEVPVPVAAPAPEDRGDFDNPMNALPSFTDMDDDEAAKHGYGWDAEGNATLNGKRY